MVQPDSTRRDSANTETGRREFLQHVAGVTAGLTLATQAASDGQAAEPAAEAAAALLPTVALGPYRITRLIIGGNPIYGYSHFNRLYSQHMMDYHTPERVVDLLRTCEAAGINTWQNSYAKRSLDDVELARREGVRFHWLCLGKPDWDAHPEHIERAASHRPIGIAPHGGLAERLHRDDKIPVLLDLLKRIRATGVLVGLSAHDPALIELAEREQWDVDYYMCCQYYLTRPRDEFEKMLGQVPIGEIYLPADRDRMLDQVRAARKPCLVYKLLAAGRTDLSPGGVRQAFEYTFSRIKPTDAVIVGMFQEFGDQVAMNARLVREICATG